MSEQVTVIAYIKSKPDKIEQTKQTLLGLIGPTRQEQGCINYDLHVDPQDPTSFVFYENWTSKQALDEHLETPHLNDFKSKFDDLLAQEVDIQIFTPVDA